MAKEYIERETACKLAMDEIPCDNCPASKIIKKSMGCNADQLHNRRELLKAAIAKAFFLEYKPEFQCRFADLVEAGERKEQE